MTISPFRGRAAARFLPAFGKSTALALALAAALVSAAQAADLASAVQPDVASQTLDPVVVTAPAPIASLTVVVDPKAPYQPVPASDGADFLKSIPGFSVIRKGGSNGDPMLRGMAGSRLNVLVDGGQIGGGCPSRMDPPTAYISPELFDRVTVIKGPETVLYGPGNSAGTVLFDRDFKRYDAPGISLDGSLLGGSWGRNDQMLDMRAGTPTFYFGLSANHTHAQDYEDGDGQRVHSSWDRWNADATLGWTPDDDTRVELTAGQGNGQAAYAFSGMDGVKFLRRSVGLKLEREHVSSTISKLAAQVYYNYADHVMDNYTLRQPDPASMMPMAMASDVDRKTVGGRVAATLKLGESLSGVIGVDGSTNDHAGRIGGPPGSMIGSYQDKPRRRDARMSSVGAFGEFTWRWAEKQRLISGARVDWAHARGYDLSVPAASSGGMNMGMTATMTADASRSSTLPAGFVRYERDLASSPATFYAGIGHAERFPDYWELFGRHVDTSVAAFTDTRPERTTQLDIGMQYHDPKMRAWISAYLGVVDDFILLHYGQGMMASSYASNVNARIAGGEAGMSYGFSRRLRADVSVAYAWGENRSDSRPLPQIPPLEARFGLNYDTGVWSTGALWRVATAQHRVAPGEGNIVGQDLGPTGGFAVFSLNGAYRLGNHVTLSAGVDNLFNRTYAEHVNAATVGLVGYANTVRVNEPGRTAWLKLNVKL